MRTSFHPVKALLARTMLLCMLLVSQYALVVHALEHPFHDAQQACEPFQGVQSLDQASLDSSLYAAPCCCGLPHVILISPTGPLADARTLPIRAPPSV